MHVRSVYLSLKCKTGVYEELIQDHHMESAQQTQIPNCWITDPLC